MNTVLRLVYHYFTATRLHRALTVGGLLACLAALYVAMNAVQNEHMLALAYPGLLAFFLGSTMMPLIFGRLAKSHAINLLPLARWKLLASALLTVLIVALPAGLMTPLAYVAGMSARPSDLANHPQLLQYTLHLAVFTYLSVCAFASWLYLASWFLGNERNVAGFAKGLMVIAILMFVPSQNDSDLPVLLKAALVQLALLWIVFGAVFLTWPRIKPALARIRSRLSRRNSQTRPAAGREVDLMLGTANPWLYLAANALPLLIVSRTGLGAPAVWLFFLTIFSTVIGAVSGQASERSRALWLRAAWSRAELFDEVERSFWRHNGVVLGAMLVLLVATWSYAGFASVLLLTGLPLLVLGTTLSTYLGLMITRGLRWAESVLGVVIMISLMTIALLLGEPGYRPLVVVMEILLAGLAVALRFAARGRWTQIDWMLCRPARLATVRGA